MRCRIKVKIWVLSFMAFLGTSLNAKAQVNTHYNLAYYDQRPYHFGFNMGYAFTGYRLQKTDERQLNSIRGVGGSGFHLGFVVSRRLGEFFDLRALPGVSFYDRQVVTTGTVVPFAIQPMEASYVELPLLVKYKSQRRKNHRMYMVLGVKPGMQVGLSKTGSPNNLQIKKGDFSLEYGFGMDIYNPMFKFSPELRFSMGLPNVMRPVQDPYSTYVEALKSYGVSLYLFFE